MGALGALGASHFRRTIRAIGCAPQTHSPCTAMRIVALLITALLLPLVPDSAAFAQAPDAKPRIEWEVKNRFRLFRNETDFQRHLASWRDDGVLGSERRLATE